MKQALLYLVTQTPLHAGAGSTSGVVDLPVAREKHTRYPLIPGSALKGALRHKAWAELIDNKQSNGTKAEWLKAFGPEAGEADDAREAGNLTLCDARLLAFPVRSLRGVWAYATCPAVLARWSRDLTLIGKTAPTLPTWPQPFREGQALVGDPGCGLFIEKDKIVLDEYSYNVATDQKVDVLAKQLAGEIFPTASGFEYFRSKFGRDLIVLSDDDFADFAVFYTLVLDRDGVSLDFLKDTVGLDVLQLGGDQSTGRGFLRGNVR